MRNEKYDKAMGGDDIKYAFEYNGLAPHLDEIESIVAEVCGEHDGCEWFWILKMKDGTFRKAEGGCDYTGWDCQSSASISEPVATVEEALALAPEVDMYKRGIRRVLTGQVKEEIPFAVYQA